MRRRLPTVVFSIEGFYTVDYTEYLSSSAHLRANKTYIAMT